MNNTKQFICLNGQMMPADNPAVMHTNRAFCYGDGLFETIHANGTRLQFFPSHYKRVTGHMSLLKMKPPPGFSEKKVEEQIVRLLNKNRLLKGARVRLAVFRNSGGYYTPATNESSFLIAATPLENDLYKLNRKGLCTAIYRDIMKPVNSFSNMKTSNSLLYIMAGVKKSETGMDDMIILNDKGRLCEGISSNLFIVKNGELFTPPLSDGCVAGIMRSQILRIARKLGYSCHETSLLPEDLKNADEFFFTNAIAGIRWVVAWEKRRFYSKTAAFLSEELNLEQFGETN